MDNNHKILKERVDKHQLKIEMIEPKVERHDEWIISKDKGLNKVKNWIQAGVVIYAAQTFGIVEVLKGLIL